MSWTTALIGGVWGLTLLAFWGAFRKQNLKIVALRAREKYYRNLQIRYSGEVERLRAQTPSSALIRENAEMRAQLDAMNGFKSTLEVAKRVRDLEVQRDDLEEANSVLEAKAAEDAGTISRLERELKKK